MRVILALLVNRLVTTLGGGGRVGSIPSASRTCVNRPDYPIALSRRSNGGTERAIVVSTDDALEPGAGRGRQRPKVAFVCTSVRRRAACYGLCASPGDPGDGRGSAVVERARRRRDGGNCGFVGPAALGGSCASGDDPVRGGLPLSTGLRSDAKSSDDARHLRSVPDRVEQHFRAADPGAHERGQLDRSTPGLQWHASRRAGLRRAPACEQQQRLERVHSVQLPDPVLGRIERPLRLVRVRWRRCRHDVVLAQERSRPVEPNRSARWRRRLRLGQRLAVERLSTSDPSVGPGGECNGLPNGVLAIGLDAFGNWTCRFQEPDCRPGLEQTKKAPRSGFLNRHPHGPRKRLEEVDCEVMEERR